MRPARQEHRGPTLGRKCQTFQCPNRRRTGLPSPVRLAAESLASIPQMPRESTESKRDAPNPFKTLLSAARYAALFQKIKSRSFDRPAGRNAIKAPSVGRMARNQLVNVRNAPAGSPERTRARLAYKQLVKLSYFQPHYATDTRARQRAPEERTTRQIAGHYVGGRPSFVVPARPMRARPADGPMKRDSTRQSISPMRACRLRGRAKRKHRSSPR